MTDQKSDLTSSVIYVAGMMELAARTAPKTKGEDFVVTRTVSGEALRQLSEAMVDFGKTRKKPNFERDASGVASSTALVLIGLKDASSVGLDCGACGFATCVELQAAPRMDSDFMGPVCAYRHLDMGIALGSASRTAEQFNVDNRIMYRAGVAARWIGLVDWDFVMGIPMSATGKNPFFDRK